MEIQHRKVSAQCSKTNNANLKTRWSAAIYMLKTKNKPAPQPKNKSKNMEKSPLFSLSNSEFCSHFKDVLQLQFAC